MVLSFFQQLRVLLWKNFTLKKRLYWVTIFEVLTPMMLFFIMVGLRKNDPVRKIKEVNYVPLPLPSAGAVAVLQEFCPYIYGRDLYNYPVHESQIDYLLDHVYSIYDNSSFQFSTNNSILAFNKTWNNFLQASRNINQLLNGTNSSDSILLDILKNSTRFSSFLKNTYNLTDEEVDAVINSEVDSGFVFRFFNPGFSQPLLRNQRSLTSTKQVIFLSSDNTDLIYCMEEKVLTSDSDSTLLISSQEKICQDTDQVYLLSNELLWQINSSSMDSGLNFSSVEFQLQGEEYRNNISAVIKGVNGIIEFIKYVDLVVDVAILLPNNSCNASPINSIDETDTNNVTLSEIKKNTGIKHSKRRKKSARKMFLDGDNNFIDLWISIQPIFCEMNDRNPQMNNEITSSQQRKFTQLFYILTSNPKVLYAPNTTAVKRIITKANTSFAVIDNITKTAVLWREQANIIRNHLEDSVFASTFAWLKNLQEIYNTYPMMINYLIADQPELQEFLASNTSLPDFDGLDYKLDVIINALCGWKSLVDLISINWFEAFETEEQAVKYAISQAVHDNVSVFATLVFEVDENGEIPSHVKYKIRQNASLTQDTKTIRVPFWRELLWRTSLPYYQFGFVWIQDIIERSLIWDFVGHEVVDPGVYIHRMPFPCYIFDSFTNNLEHIMPLTMILSFVYSVAIIVQQIVYEKEQRLKEVMKMMGLSNGVHWLAWFISVFFQFELTVTAICGLLKFGPFAILPKSDFVIMWLFISAFAIATINFCFLVSAFFSKAKVASACSTIIYFLTYLPYAYMSIQEYILLHPVNFYAKSAASLVSTTTFGLGVRYFAIFELSGTGAQWHNIATTPLEGDTFSLLQAMIMLAVDAFLYALLTWYIEAVFPGQYGLPKPWYFPLTYSYWIGHDTNDDDQKSSWFQRLAFGYKPFFEKNNQMFSLKYNNPLIEPEPSHLNLGIQIENLTKVYKNNKKAVNNLSLNFYEDQITSFLGHNGAGKTTTMSILTGLIPPTSGTACIYGQDIRYSMPSIRKNLGMCPQHNALFEHLTVKEHLWFYGLLKGVSKKMIRSTMRSFLDDVGLTFKRNTKVKALSGGMKRKLSVAIAFVGGSQTVILDEPTAGVDPYARRAIWDLIVKYKQGRTILLSTHHMDEADLLGDRIAIISNGQLLCCGSSLFLKSNYGEGYNLTLLKKVSGGSIDDSEQKKSADELSEKKIANFVQSHIETAVIINNSSNQITFNLPFKAVRKGWFQKFFSALPQHMVNLKITGYGLTDTTLEEVFLKVDNQKNKPIMEAQTDLSREDVAETSLLIQSSRKKSFFSTADSDGPERELLEMKRNSQKYAVVDDQSSLNSTEIHPLAVDEQENGLDKKSINLSMDSLHNIKNDSKLIPVPENKPQKRKRSSLIANLETSVVFARVLQGLLAKRFQYSMRDRKAIFYQIMLPALFVSIAMTVALSLPSSSSSHNLELSTTQYYNLTQPEGNYIPYTDQSFVFPIAPDKFPEVDANTSEIFKTFFLPSGVGATCVLRDVALTRSSFHGKYNLSEFNPNCISLYSSSQTSGFVQNPTYSSQYAETDPRKVPCTCSDEGSTYVCTESFGDFPKTKTVVTGDHLINVTGKAPVMPYLMYTTNKYQTHRYGAFSLNEIRANFKERNTSRPPTLRKLCVRKAAQVFFNRRAFHAMPTYLNILNNAILRANLPASVDNPSKYGITVINHPMNKTAGILSLDFLLSGTDVVIAVFVIVAMSFVPASFLVFLVSEKQSKAKHLQFISGTGPFTYWLSNYLWDMLNYLFPAMVCILILCFFDLPAYTRGNNIYAVIALFVLYGWSMTPMMYPASFYFTVPSTAYIFMIVINLFVGITTVITTFMLSLFNTNPLLMEVNDIVSVVFLIFPNYNLGKGLMDLSYYEFINDFYRSTGQYNLLRDPFEWEIISRSMFSMAIFGLVGFILTLLCEVRFFLRSGTDQADVVLNKERNKKEDVDVAKERERVDRIAKLKRDDDLIVVNNISKVFSQNKGHMFAVNRLSFAVARGECFGLLGVNGAGKTTTFQMITGALNVTSGSIRIAGHTITGERAQERLLAQQSTGYCPQFDALFNLLTPLEHLHLFAKLRGVHRKAENRIVNWVIRKLDLTQYSDKPSMQLSGGNRRKLSVAIALVGNPPVVLLDEPTAGMDPAARRFLWDLIRNMTRSGRAVLLTSHSMEECEVLCGRIAIMVNGSFKCVGPVQHLKNRFGGGYMVSVRCSEPDLFTNAFKSQFPLAVLKEQHYHKTVFQLFSSDKGATPLNLAEVFKMLEERKTELKIDDYSVSQTTLDDVFVNFASKQGSPEGVGYFTNPVRRFGAMVASVVRWFMLRLFGINYTPARSRLVEETNDDN